MIYINQTLNQFSFDERTGGDWQAVSTEQFNSLRQSGWDPTNAPSWAISNADLRRALIARGINPDSVTNYLKSLPDGPDKWAALTDWEYANYFERAHPLLDQLAPSFGMTTEDVDNIYRDKPAYPRL